MKIEITICLISAGAALGLALWAYRKSRKSGEAGEPHLDTLAGIISLLRAAAPALVTAAEKLFGGGTGEVKLSWVIAELVKLIPDAIKALVGPAELEAIVDEALEGVRGLWNDVPGLVG